MRRLETRSDMFLPIFLSALRVEKSEVGMDSLGQEIPYFGEVANVVDDCGNIVGSMLYKLTQHNGQPLVWVDSVYVDPSNRSTNAVALLLQHIRETYPGVPAEGYLQEPRLRPIIDRYNQSLGVQPMSQNDILNQMKDSYMRQFPDLGRDEIEEIFHTYYA